MTSQLPIEDWHDYIGDPTLADAILDRIYIGRIESISRPRSRSERPRPRRSSPGPAPKKAASDASIRDPKTRSSAADAADRAWSCITKIVPDRVVVIRAQKRENID